LAGTQEAAYRLCNAVHSMLDLYAEFTSSRHHDQISSLPLVASEPVLADITAFIPETISRYHRLKPIYLYQLSVDKASHYGRDILPYSIWENV